MLPVAFPQIVTRLRSPAPGRHGDPGGPPVETPMQAYAVWPSDGNGSGGNEQTDRQDTVFVGYNVMFSDPHTDARPTDQWRYRGQVYEQVGVAAYYPNPFTGTEVLTIQIGLVTG